MQHTLYIGHVIDVLKKLIDEGTKCNCVVTSPPYWGLRDYGTEPQIWDANHNCEHEWASSIKHRTSGGPQVPHTKWQKNIQIQKAQRDTKSMHCTKCGAWKGQLGLEPHFNLYIKHLCDVFDLIKQVLKDSGTCWVNVGDTYWGGGQGGGEKQSVEKEGYGHVAIGSDYRNKRLCLIPSRFGIEMVNRGWIERVDVIWEKPNAMPESVKDRFTVDYEHLFLFVRNPKYYFEQQFERHKPRLMRYSKRGKGSIDGVEDRNVGLDKNVGKYSSKRNLRCVWRIKTEQYPEAHFAIFPRKLVRIPIKAGCPEGGIVLDPFVGSGTTMAEAEQQRKNSIGIDLKYEKLVQRRLGLTPSIVQKGLGGVDSRLDIIYI